MYDSLAIELMSVLSSFCNIITVGQKDITNSTELAEPAGQTRQELRRIDQPIPLGMFYQIAAPAVGLWRIESAVIDTVLKMKREIARYVFCVVAVESSDRTCRTGQERSERPSFVSLSLRLGKDK